MSGKRQELQEALCQYTTDTLTYIDTVRGFCEGISAWMDAREKELSKLEDIKDKADKVDLSYSHVTKSEKNNEALGENMKNDVTPKTTYTTYSSREELLTAVLADTLGGLKKLDHFLEAVEKLAVTSLHVFMEENQVLHLPEGISFEYVQVVIIAAGLICPLLLEFKRDASVFFLPKLQNVEVLPCQLDKYIKTTRIICEELEKSQRVLMTENHLADLGRNLSEDDIQRIVCHINQHFELRLRFQRTATETVVDLDVDLSEDEIQRMLDHINQLHKIRMDQNFRLVFLFQDVSCSGFINEFKKRQPRMLQFLTDLEGTAVQLDRMNKGAKISSVAGSSVGAVGGVLSIVGLALIPVTAGLSLGLTIGGTACGITSGVNSVVTTATEMRVNRKQQNKANEVFQSFMEDVQGVQKCLDEVISQEPSIIVLESEWDKSLKVARTAGSVGQSVKSLVNEVSALRSLRRAKYLNTSTPKWASDIRGMGRPAAKGSLALSKTARAGFIGLNALFLGMDILTICKDSYSLAKGSETEVSKLIRARAALWSSEIDSWQKIHDSLGEGQKTSEEHRAVLDEIFYPERAIKENESLCNDLPTSKNEHVVLDNLSDPEIERRESFQTRTVNFLMKNKIVLCIVIAAIAFVATLFFISDQCK